LWLKSAKESCFLQSEEVFAPARKFFAKAGKFSSKARKFAAKFDVFRFKHFMSEPKRDVNQSSQIETDAMHNLSGFGPDLQARTHVRLLEKLDSLRFELPSIRQKLPSFLTSTSSFVRNFLAQT
jgi:hypothetical protein